MKSKLALILIIIGVVIVLFAFLSGRSKPVKIGKIESFSLSYTTGNTANANVRYALTVENGVCTAAVKPVNVPPEDERTFVVDADFVRELEQILIDNEVGKWNGFDKTDKNVMDGDSFSLYITMADGASVDAHGYMRWPKNYAAVRDAVEALFDAHMPQT